MNCTNCNEKLEANAVFCANCGEKVVHQASPNFNNDAAVGPTFNNAGGGTAAVQEKVKTNLNVIIPIALVALVLIGAFMLFSGGGKPETVVSNFFKSIDKVDPDMMLDTLSSRLKNEVLEDVGWDKSELAYEISDMKEGFRYEFGDSWLKQVKVTSDYKDKNSAVVSIFMFGEYKKIRLFKEGKKWVIMEMPGY